MLNRSSHTISRLATTLLILLSVSLTTVAKGDNDEDFTHNRAYLTGCLTSSDTWHLEGGYHYMLCKLLGIGGGFGLWENWYEDGYASGRDWAISDDDNKPYNLYLRPSVIVRSPSLILGQVDLSLYAEPGIMLNVPYRSAWIETTHDGQTTDYDHISTGKGQWLAFDARLGVCLSLGRACIIAGYTMSNLDIYSQTRHLRYKGVSFREFYPSKPFMQGAFATLAYHF